MFREILFTMKNTLIELHNVNSKNFIKQPNFVQPHRDNKSVSRELCQNFKAQNKFFIKQVPIHRMSRFIQSLLNKYCNVR